MFRNVYLFINLLPGSPSVHRSPNHSCGQNRVPGISESIANTQYPLTNTEVLLDKQYISSPLPASIRYGKGLTDTQYSLLNTLV